MLLSYYGSALGWHMPKHMSQRELLSIKIRFLHTDRKSTRLNSSHLVISYAVFCLKKKKKHKTTGLSTLVEIPTKMGRPSSCLPHILPMSSTSFLTSHVLVYVPGAHAHVQLIHLI